MRKRRLKIRIRPAANGEFYSTIHGGNGQVMFTSETYKRHRDCKKTAELVQDLLWYADIDDCQQSKGAEIREVT